MRIMSKLTEWAVVVLVTSAATGFAATSAATNDLHWLDVVRRYADTMLERGRDVYGPQ